MSPLMKNIPTVNEGKYAKAIADGIVNNNVEKSFPHQPRQERK